MGIGLAPLNHAKRAQRITWVFTVISKAENKYQI
jgi:hypothetical protein